MIACTLIFGACSNPSSEDQSSSTNTQQAEEPTVTVATGFALGADISWASQLEYEGYKFYTVSGTEMECTALMKEIGMNAVRFRVWVNPSSGWCNKSDVLIKCRTAQKLGMRIMIDFHYSDTWADPGSQIIPAAWVNYSASELVDAVTTHTTEVLTLLKNNGVDVEWVQVGNETRLGMLYHLDEAKNISSVGGLISTNPSTFAALFQAGYDATKAVYPDASVLVHVDEGNNFNRVKYVCSVLDKYSTSYDMVALSLYPGDDWNTYAPACVSNISTIYSTYGKPVMISEIGMNYAEADETYAMLSYFLSACNATGHCEGVFYWEPEAPAGYNGGYSMGAFENNAPTHALDAFTEFSAE